MPEYLIDQGMKRCLIIVCILAFGLIICGCTSDTPKDTIASDKYVAILEVHTDHSTLIGTPPYTQIQPPPIPTPVPVLDFDNSHGVTKDYLQECGVAVNDGFKALLFQESYIDTPTTIGFQRIAMGGIYSLPYTMDVGFTIVNITSNGTIMATCDNRSIMIMPGENMTISVSGVNTTGAYLANRYGNNSFDWGNMTELPWPVHNEQVYVFTNEGIFNKSLLNDAYMKK